MSSAPQKLTMQDLQDLGIIPDAEQVGARGLPSTSRLGNPGGFSETYEHPTDPSLAVRIADPNDGWVSYALDNHGRPHAPRLDQLGWYQGKWIAVVERLTDYNPSYIPEHKEFSDVICAMLRADCELFAEEIMACNKIPGLTKHLEQFFEMPKFDGRIGNVMFRGEPGNLMPILNDPIPETPDTRIILLQDAWSIELPVLEDPFVADPEIGAPTHPNGPR